MNAFQLALTLIFVAVEVLLVSGYAVPAHTDTNQQNRFVQGTNSKQADSAKGKYEIQNQASTEKTHESVIIDYYDYGQDQPMEETYKPLKPEPQKAFAGCPDLTIFCQQHCEASRYYSGYCEKKACICYGKL